MTNKEIKQKAKLTFNDGKWTHILASLISTMLLSVSSSFALITGGPIMYGQYNYFLKLTRKEPTELNDLFCGVNRFKDTLIEYIFMTLKILLWSLLFIVPGIIKWHAYAMTWFILLDNPNMEGGQAHKQSAEMMKGHKMELFKLQLSFFWWYVLIFLTFGLAAYYIQPHITLSITEFYENLKNEKN